MSATKKVRTLEELKQVGSHGYTEDHMDERAGITIPVHRSMTRRSLISTGELEVSIQDFSEEDLTGSMPSHLREQGYGIDPESLVVKQRQVVRGGEEFSLASVQYKLTPPSLFTDTEDLLKALDKAKAPKKILAPVPQDRYLLALLGDFQMGQADDDGTDGIVRRIQQIPAEIKKEVEKNRKLRTPISRIVLFSLGDLVEGVAYFYANQAFTVQLDRRDQVKVARRLFAQILIELATLGIPITVITVPGNHGENRNALGAGTSTTINDNDDVALVEQIQEGLELNPEKFGHIDFMYPAPERLSLTVNLLGHIIGVVHGHQVGGGGNLAASIRGFIGGQKRAAEPLGFVNYLFMGHFHHFYCERLSENVMAVMNGAMCSKSAYFLQRYGMGSTPEFVMGVLTKDGDEGFHPVKLK